MLGQRTKTIKYQQKMRRKIKDNKNYQKLISEVDVFGVFKQCLKTSKGSRMLSLDIREDSFRTHNTNKSRKERRVTHK
jgi:hypothetical protein